MSPKGSTRNCILVSWAACRPWWNHCMFTGTHPNSLLSQLELSLRGMRSMSMGTQP